jgi:predicted RNA-binding Zn-ribbon protein involved in translation (DUF1610 family)
MIDNNLAAPCGIYCGACRHYLALKKNQLEQRGFKRGCEGCRIRNKNCAFIRRDCPALKKNQIEYCYECNSFPCQNLQKMDHLYQNRYAVNMIGNLKRIKEIGVARWLQEQKVFYICPQCGGEICIHDEKCYDCGNKMNPNKN